MKYLSIFCLIILLGVGGYKTYNATINNNAQISSSSSKSNISENKSINKSKKDLDLDAVANGDWSSLEGTWENGRGELFTFSENGVILDKSDGTAGYTLHAYAENYKTTTKNLVLNAGWKNGTGFAIKLAQKNYPYAPGTFVDVDNDGNIVRSKKGEDTTDINRDRFLAGQNSPSLKQSADLAFYRVD